MYEEFSRVHRARGIQTSVSSSGWKSFLTTPIPTGFTQQDKQKPGGSMKNTSKPPVKEGKSGEMLDPMGVAAVPKNKRC